MDRAVVLAFNAPAAGFVVPNDYVASYVARDPARLIGFGAVDPSADSAIDELERMKSDLGLVGCKLGPIYQDVDPLGPEFLRVCEALERLELPMLIHRERPLPAPDRCCRRGRSCWTRSRCGTRSSRS